MIPNELGKAAGFTKRDARNLGRAEQQLEQAYRLIKEWEEVTGQTCPDSEDCATLLQQHRLLAEKFFATDPDDPAD